MNYRNVQNIQSILFCLLVLVIGNVSGSGSRSRSNQSKTNIGQMWWIIPAAAFIGNLMYAQYRKGKGPDYQNRADKWFQSQQEEFNRLEEEAAAQEALSLS